MTRKTPLGSGWSSIHASTLSLLGPVAANVPLPLALPRTPGWQTFGSAGADLKLRPADSWEVIASCLPDPWQAEMVIVWLGHEAVPIGIWSSPRFLVAFMPDGFRHWHACRQLAPRCDLVVADVEGAMRLRRLGIDRVHIPTRWDDGPSLPDSTVSEGGRDLDLLFLGDLHPATGREHLPWLGRLAQLGARWRVHLGVAKNQHEPEKLLRRARIYFHHGSEIADHQRLWAAAAAGALPFVPLDTEPAGPLWRDRHNCVRYSADNLEAELEYYLDNEEECRRLGEAAQATACSPAKVGFWPELLKVLEREPAAQDQHAARRPPWDRQHELVARAWQALYAGKSSDETLTAELAAAVAAVPGHVALRQALGLLSACQGDHATAAEHFRRVLDLQPRHVLAGLNRAEALVRAGRRPAAIEQARRTLVCLDGMEDLDFAWLDSPPYPNPMGPDVFAVEWERAAWQHAGDAKGECRAKHALLCWRLHGLLARQTGELTHRYEAALARPDLPATRATLGSALCHAGRPAEAVHQLHLAISANPFDAAVARLLDETLSVLGRQAEQRHLRQQRRLLHQAAPQVVASESWFAPPVVPIRVAPRPHISLCMIVKDEEANLPRCLTSVVDLVEEIIVVDTGSHDATKNVARRYDAKVYDFVWCDSFAAARNKSLRHATGAWIFWLDADDTLDTDSRQKLRTLFATLGHDLAVYLMRQHSQPDPVSGSALVVDQAKLFRNDPRLRWEYRVHEQIVPAVLRLGGELRTTDIVFQHSGYHDPHVRRRKLERNRRLLLLDQAERPDDPLILFNLGTLHLDLGRHAEAVAFFQRGLERAPANYTLIPRLHGLLTSALYRLGRKEEALAVCRRGRAAYPDEGDLLYWHAQLLCETGDESGAEACWRRLLSLRTGPALASLDPGIHGYKSRHQLAQLYRRQGRSAEALQLWQQAVAEQPDYVPAWLGLTELSLSIGREAELAVDIARLESSAATQATAWMVRAHCHLVRREFAAAIALLEEAVGSSPHLLWARLLLGQTLVREGRNRETALRVLREVLALDPQQPEALRLVARLENSAEFASRGN